MQNWQYHTNYIICHLRQSCWKKPRFDWLKEPIWMRWNRCTCKSVCIPPLFLIRPEELIHSTVSSPEASWCSESWVKCSASWVWTGEKWVRPVGNWVWRFEGQCIQGEPSVLNDEMICDLSFAKMWFLNFYKTVELCSSAVWSLVVDICASSFQNCVHSAISFV